MLEHTARKFLRESVIFDSSKRRKGPRADALRYLNEAHAWSAVDSLLIDI